MTEEIVTPAQLADVARMLRLDVDGHGPALLVAIRHARVVWANAAALAVLSAADCDAVGEILFRSGPAGRAFAQRLSRLGAEPLFGRLSAARAWPPTPVTMLCTAVGSDGADPLALIRLDTPAEHANRPALQASTLSLKLAPAAHPVATTSPEPSSRILWETNGDGIVTRVGPTGGNPDATAVLPLGTPIVALFRDDAPAVAETLEDVLRNGGSTGATRVAWRRPGSNDPLAIEIGCTRRAGRDGLRGFLLVSGANRAPSLALTAVPPLEKAVPQADAPVSPPNGDEPAPAGAGSDVTKAEAAQRIPPVPEPGEAVQAAPAGDNVVHFPALRPVAPPASKADMRPAVDTPAGERVGFDTPVWAESPDDLPQALTDDERDAFAHIAKVLGTQQSPSETAVEARPPAPTSTTAPDAVQDVIDVLPIGILVRREAHLDANPALLRQTGDGSAEALRVRFSGSDPTEPGMLTRTDGRAIASEVFDVEIGRRPARLLVTAAKDAFRPSDDDDHRLPSREILEAVAKNGFVRFDEAGRIADASAKAALVLSDRGETLIGRPLSEVLAFETDPDWDAGSPGPQTHLATTRAAEPVPLTVNVVPLAAGALGLLSTARPSEPARSDADAALREAERTSAMKSEFLAKVSHEIRTPLNAILGFAEVIRDERLGPVGNSRYLEYLNDIHASGTLVLSLVNDLLDLSRIEAGRMNLELEAVDANAIVQSCVNTLQTQAHRGRIIMRLSLAPHLPSALADARSLRQIVLNLLSNAVKFNEPGGQVIVSTAPVGADAVTIRIRDTGIGMTDDEVAAAMEPFRQLSTVDRTGSGLGLPLTKALVEANCASMAIKSGRGEGTLVEVTFPVVERSDVSLPA